MPAEIQATSGGTEQAGRQLSGLWHRDIVAQHREGLTLLRNWGTEALRGGECIDVALSFPRLIR
jgi:hypothetical protein